jgi:hypothetical protein
VRVVMFLADVADATVIFASEPAVELIVTTLASACGCRRIPAFRITGLPHID